MRILYVEDDPMDADLSLRQLRKTAPHFRVERVATMAEAVARLERLEAQPLELVLTDVGLPDGDGLSLLAFIREQTLPLAVVVITGAGDEETAVAALKSGAEDYVVKRKDYLTRLPLTLETALQRYRAGAARRARLFKVLYGEHSAPDMDLTRRHFARHAPNFQLDVAVTGPEVVARLLQSTEPNGYDVVLLDYRLTGLNALELLKELRQPDRQSVPVVLLTVQGAEEIALQAIKLGASSYVVKNPGYLHQLPVELENAVSRAESMGREEALRERRRRYQLATAAGSVGVWDWHLKTNNIYLDSSLKALLGYENDELSNHIDGWGLLVHPSDVDRVTELARAYLSGAIPSYEIEHRALHKDGSVRWFLARGTAVRNDGGRALRMVGTDTDITERKRAEEAAQITQELLQSTIDALDAHIAILDENARIIAVNEPWRRFARTNGADGGVGRNYEEVCQSSMRREDTESVLQGIRAVMNGERKDFRFVYQSCHGTEEAWFQLRVNRFYSRGILRLVLAHENITEIEQAHDALRQLTRRLLQSQDEERRRIARELHDSTVQNLGALIAHLAFLRKRAGPLESQNENRISESVSLCEQVIKEIRTLSYLLHPPLLDEMGLASALQWYARGFSQRSGIQVEVAVVQDIGRLTSEVEMALFRVVQESLTNIHRHAGSASANIRLMKDGDHVLVQVKDRGRGMRLDSDSGDTIQSLGVGILGMRERLRQLGGRLEIESSYVGTTVTAIVPFARRAYAANSAGG